MKLKINKFEKLQKMTTVLQYSVFEQKMQEIMEQNDKYRSMIKDHTIDLFSFLMHKMFINQQKPPHMFCFFFVEMYEKLYKLHT
jgi:hypothetical protein